MLFLLMAVVASLRFGSPVAASADEGAPKRFVHPGLLQTQADLDFIRAKVNGGEQPWKGAWESMLADRVASLDYQPHPIADVIRGTSNNPDIGSSAMMFDSAAAYSQAIQWAVTGDARHRARRSIS